MKGLVVINIYDKVNNIIRFRLFIYKPLNIAGVLLCQIWI
jgi:hypothetical protein